MQNYLNDIKVVVRCRPLTKREIEDGQVSVLINGQISANQQSQTFDKVLQGDQKELYSQTVYSLIENSLLGYDGTVFVYGETGTGKTYTLVGNDEPDSMGIIPRTFEHIFKRIVWVSYYEIYNEEITDLLERKRLKQTDSCINSILTKNQLEMYEKFKLGRYNLAMSRTHMSCETTCSHCIFSITLSKKSKFELKETLSRLNFVDLAGSENLQRGVGQVGDRLKVSKQLNISLTTFVNVINQLSENEAQKITYPDSKLTWLLQQSFVGNCQTLLIVTISPAKYRLFGSIAALVFAERAKQIKFTPQNLVNLFQQQIIQQKKRSISVQHEIIVKKNKISKQLRRIKRKILNYNNIE